MTHCLFNLFNRLSLQTAITIPFVVQVVAVVGVVGYLSFRNGQVTVNYLASQLRQESTARILLQLETTVEDPHIINKINANSLSQGDIDLLTGQGEHQFWQQSQVFPETNLIYCATEAEGAFVGMGRGEGGLGPTVQSQVASPATDRLMHYYEVGPTGRRTFSRSKGNRTYDPRIRPWYEAAKQRNGPTWSAVYLDFDTLLPTITASTPVYKADTGELLGVCATDIILSEELNLFLKRLSIGKSGIAFIMEPSGLLIASSTPEPITVGRAEDTARLRAIASANPLIQATAQYLETHYGQLDRVESSQLEFAHDGDRHYLEVVRFQDDYGLDWIVVLAVPEQDFMAQIHRNTQITLLLCGLALLATVLIGVMLTRWLTQPLRQLSANAKSLAQGEWQQTIALDRADVVGDLSRSFSTMAEQLEASFSSLEQRVEERTTELLRLNQELKRLAEIDGLTQTANRRYFDISLEQQWHRLVRAQQPLSLLLCDIDYFKGYNDTYGHLVGDQCLQQLAATFMALIQRPADLVARYGGEEFVILLPHTDLAGATYLAQTICTAVSNLHIPHSGAPLGQITVSIGIATVIPDFDHRPDALVAAADQALYAAKSKGRNGYCIAPDLDTLFPSR